SQKMVKIIVYSDYICPFCYIGFHRIKKLKKQFNLDVEWRPFELHPEIPKEGIVVEKLPFSNEYLEMIIANVKQLAEEAGITFEFSGKLPNSRLALIISEFAKEKGKFSEFHELIFEKYWKEGKDIGDLSILLEFASSIGLDKNEILAYIKSEEPVNKLKNFTSELGRYGINGVPTFIIGDRIVVGAQPYEVFEKVINQVSD
ncbi:MAG: DsbA family oxidoreductase, partial [Promethearchaeota archaeon]